MYKIGLFFSLVSLSLIHGMDIDLDKTTPYIATFQKSSLSTLTLPHPRPLSINRTKFVDIHYPQEINRDDLQLALTYFYFGLRTQSRTVTCDMRPLEKLLCGSLTVAKKQSMEKFLEANDLSRNFQEVRFRVNNKYDFTCKIPKNDQIGFIVFKTLCEKLNDSLDLSNMLMGPAIPMKESRKKTAFISLFTPNGLRESFAKYIRRKFNIAKRYFNNSKDLLFSLKNRLYYINHLTMNHYPVQSRTVQSRSTRIDKSSIM